MGSKIDQFKHQSISNNLHRPRILCLHGGGSNAKIFKAQTRALRAELDAHFRFVFVQAPFSSEPGPDVTSVYKDFGPFRRWLRSKSEHPCIDEKEAVEHIDEAIYEAMDRDDLQGATGNYVGLLGFSQGAKLAASILFRQQVRTKKLGKYLAGSSYRFAILMNGRGPLVALEPNLFMSSALLNASQISMTQPPTARDLQSQEHVLRLPTIHVHGLSDPGLLLHQSLRDHYFAREATLIQWDGQHRVPIKTRDVAPLALEILNMAKATGSL